MKRNERVGALVKILCDSPNRIFTLSYFTEIFDSAKSTVSEDLVVVKKLMDSMKLGKVITLPGASGGVKYIPNVTREKRHGFLQELCNRIQEPGRVIPGGYLYLADLLCHPDYVSRIGAIFAERFINEQIQTVVTVETRGIPIAMMTAHYLNVPLVIVRNENKPTEGPTVSINYISGSKGDLKTMYVPKRAIRPNSNVLIIDAFLRGGGTVKGLEDLVQEFDAHVCGVGVLVEFTEPVHKLVNSHYSLLKLVERTSDASARIVPNPEV